jgi:hypothetical protein
VTIDKAEILSRISKVEESEEMRRARSLLDAWDTRPLSEAPVVLKVSQALSLWKTRLRISIEITKRPICGAQALVDKLLTLDPGADLEQFSFINSEMGGNVFFERANHNYVGVTLGLPHEPTHSQE